MIRNATRLFGLVAAGFLTVFSGCYSGSRCEEPICSEPSAIHPTLRQRPVPHGLGVNIHFYAGNERDWAMMDAAGVELVRMDVSWAGGEPEPGVFDFSRYDALIAELKKRKMTLLFILDYGNDLYDEGVAPHSGKARMAFARFAAALAKRYADDDVIWELWNEPNLDHFWKPKVNFNDYMQWCQTVVPAIRASDPKACIVGAATSSFDLSFLESCFKQGYLELVDGVSVHPYRNATRGPETALDDYDTLTALIEQYNPGEKKYPILSGEWGYTTTHMSPELQGKYLARQWLCNTAYGVPVSVWYDWHDDGQDPDESEHNFGTVTWDYHPKPAYTAMTTLIAELKGYHSAGRISLGDTDDFILPFLKGDSVKLVVWTTGDAHEIDLGADFKASKIVSPSGASTDDARGSRIAVSDEPLYLSVAAPLPAWLELVVQGSRLDAAQASEAARCFLERSFFRRSPRDRYAKALRHAIESGTIRERQTAFGLLLRLADTLQTERPLARRLYRAVLDEDTDVLNRRRAVAGLSRTGALESLGHVAPLLRDPDLMQPVAQYYLLTAFQLAEEKNAKARELLLNAAAVCQDRFMVERVLSRMEETGHAIDESTQKTLARNAGFINRWWIAGPFPNASERAKETAYFPELGIDFAQTERLDTGTAVWQELELDGIYPIVPFADLYGKKELAAYAYAELQSPKPQAARFKIGSNDGVVCWLNGKKVHENRTSRGLTVDEDTVSVQLKEGVNRILLRVLNEGSAWEACLRVCDAQGMPLDIERL